ncbi:MAG: hypothetical protein HY727_03605 [Candidatus Rokubacteria bacterium]|nr:hypothetical protein [Candidatus Rokubacteria bacterium]
MTPEPQDFEQFSRDLDEEWLRRRLLSDLPTRISAAEEDELARQLGRADPLVEAPGPHWLEAIRHIVASWPGRLAVAGSMALLLVAGFFVGRVSENGPGGHLPGAVPPKPVYEPERAIRLGITAPVKAESYVKFREAMALYGAPDFPSKALPLLREAVAADPTNEEAQFWLGAALLLERKPAEAIGPLEEARHLAPRSAQYGQYLLYAYLQAGAVDKALALQAEILRRP